MKRSSKKGFTLAELLIVIAIIAILIAVMFPVFGAQLDKARAAADLANVRARYSELVADAMLGGDENQITADWDDYSITISAADLEAACQYGSSVTPDDDDKTITVTYTNGAGNAITGSFVCDEDVVLTN